jgi:Glutamate decarboxylase and related PLP-dependent proteins
VGGRVHRVRARGGGRVHERWDGLEHDRARRGEHALPGSRYEGLGGKRVAIYCSQEVHYSGTRAVETLGVGSANLRAIPLGAERGLAPEALAEAIDRDLADGVTPIAVVATAGTTLTGAIDPLEAIADICEQRGVWFHVDGAYGLPAVAARPELFAGFERAHSVAVDAHKWLYLPKACGILLVRNQGDLVASFGHEQGYLPHQRHELTRWRRRSSTRGPSAR